MTARRTPPRQPRPAPPRKRPAQPPAKRPRMVVRPDVPAARRAPGPRATPRGGTPRSPARRRRALRLGGLNGRLRYGFVAVCVLLLVIGARLVQLQGLDGTKYAGAAAAQRVESIPLHALRGQIVDRTGTVLAYTSNAQDITVDPQQIKAAVKGDPGLLAGYEQTLAPLVGKTQAQVGQVLLGPGQYGVLATALSEAQAQQITAKKFIGVYTQATTQRQYPGGTTAANVIGFVHSDGSGGAGIEYEFNRQLAGVNGNVTFSVDNVGDPNPAGPTHTVPAQNGDTIRLTIDQSLQFTAQHYLDQAVAASGARSAEAVVEDAHTGQVLAMASSGTFDAADPSPQELTGTTPLNPPVMSTFEPGSVQKVITFAAALESGAIKPSTIIPVPPDIYMGGVRISDAWYHPTERFTATGILAESSNVGTLKIAQLIGPKIWDSYEKRFGVGTRTGIDLPAEASGYLPPRSQWSASSFANLPFGQGESMTLMRLATIYQTIADNGVQVEPRIVRSVTAADGTVTPTPQPKGVRIIKAQTAKTLRTMLESVILPGGTGTAAAVPGYVVAGKTGTAQQPDPNTGKYSSTMNWDTFAGMIPADNPQFVVAIMVDNPAHGAEGGDVSAPLFHEIASYEVAHAHVAPTGAKAKHVPLQVCDAVTRYASPSTVC